MNIKQLVAISLAGVSCATSTMFAQAGEDHGHQVPAGLVREVRLATEDFRDVNVAYSAGYAPSGGCVSGSEEGAMGLHLANGQLFADGALDAQHPEVLVYEAKNGRLRLVAVEFVVLADQWHENNPAPPVLMGQHFHYVGSPNRYGLQPFYELHVWAWKSNPHGMFVDWNPVVSCEEFSQ
jgi:hypothetical protein